MRRSEARRREPEISGALGSPQLQTVASGASSARVILGEHCGLSMTTRFANPCLTISSVFWVSFTRRQAALAGAS